MITIWPAQQRLRRRILQLKHGLREQSRSCCGERTHHCPSETSQWKLRQNVFTRGKFSVGKLSSSRGSRTNAQLFCLYREYLSPNHRPVQFCSNRHSRLNRHHWRIFATESLLDNRCSSVFRSGFGGRSACCLGSLQARRTLNAIPTG